MCRTPQSAWSFPSQPAYQTFIECNLIRSEHCCQLVVMNLNHTWCRPGTWSCHWITAQNIVVCCDLLHWRTYPIPENSWNKTTNPWNSSVPEINSWQIASFSPYHPPHKRTFIPPNRCFGNHFEVSTWDFWDIMDLLDVPGILQSFSSTIFMKMMSMYVCRSCHWESLTCKCLNAKHAVSNSVSEQCLGSDLSTDKPREILAEPVARNNSWY